MDLDRNGFEVLDRAGCWARLGSTLLGRVAFHHVSGLVVLPVNHAVVDEELVIGTHRGSMLDQLADGTEVAFEADHFDGLYRAGWSVLVRGTIHHVVDERSFDRARRPSLDRWSPRAIDLAVAITPVEVSGRRIVTPSATSG